MSDDLKTPLTPGGQHRVNDLVAPLKPASSANATKAASQQPPKKRDLSGLNPLGGVRGLAAVLIVCGHFVTNFAPVTPDRWPAFPVEYFSPVTLFFLVSGVALSYVYDPAKDSGADGGSGASAGAGAAWSGEKIKDFFGKRVARIAPMYFVCLLISLPVLIRFNSDAQAVAENLILAPLFVQSFTGLGNDWAPHLWQVSAFMLSYATYPWLLPSLKRRTRRHWLWIGVVCWAVPLIGCAAMMATDGPAGIIHTEFVFRYPQFVVGVLLGLVLIDAEQSPAAGASAVAAAYTAAATSDVRPVSGSGAVVVSITTATASSDPTGSNSGWVHPSRAACVVWADRLSVLLLVLWWGCPALSYTIRTDGTETSTHNGVNSYVWWWYMLWAEFALLPLHCAWCYCLVRAGTGVRVATPTAWATGGGGTVAVLNSAIAQLLGGVSYSLYVIHYPLFFLLGFLKTSQYMTAPLTLRNRGAHMGFDETVDGPYAFECWELLPLLGLLVVLGQFCERYIESPARDALQRFFSGASNDKPQTRAAAS